MNRQQVFTYSVTTPPRLVDRTQFEDIIIRAEENGGALRLKDVARVELGALTYGFSGTFNGSPAVPIAVYLQPGANALQVAAEVKATMDRMSKRFPVGLRYDIPFDTTRFVEVSIEAPKVQDERTKELFRELAKLHTEDPRAEMWQQV